MTTDDHDGDDADKPTRDEKGRWRPGYCPNLKGRPKKKPKSKVSYDQSDIRIFGSTIVDIMANGKKESMDRRTALINKMFESAMKGKVSMQRFLYKEFERNAERLAAARVRYDRLMLDWVINNPDFKKPDFDIPFEVEVEMLSLRALLNYYFPDQYPLHGMSAKDDDDEKWSFRKLMAFIRSTQPGQRR